MQSRVVQQRLASGSSLLWQLCPSSRRALPARAAATTGSSGATQQQQAAMPKPQIQDLAKMAQIKVTDKEAADWTPKIHSILDWFGQLQAVDTDGVVPAVHAYSEGNRLRPDEPHAYAARAELLAQPADTEKGYVRVPKTGGGDGPAPADKGKSAAVLSSASAGSVSGSSGSSVDDAGASAGAGAVDWAAVQALDIRVGRIVGCERHPDAESLYVEKIDVGEAEPRTIVSGLVKYVPLEQMQDRMVVIISNLKPRNMRGIKSFGMVLAASNAEHSAVEPLMPPAGAKPGERVWFGDKKEQAAPLAANSVEKKKVWESVQPLLSTSDACVASLGGMAMNTSAGPVVASSLKQARVA